MTRRGIAIVGAGVGIAVALRETGWTGPLIMKGSRRPLAPTSSRRERACQVKWISR